MRTAILGATGYIGLSLARRWAEDAESDLALFARDPARLARGGAWPSNVTAHDVESFEAGGFDLVINSIGAGDPGRVGSLGAEILDITSVWDDRILRHLRPDAGYVFISSGVVHGAPPFPAYTTSKIDAERRHRDARDKAVLDVRVFAYAETNLNLDGTFLLAQLARSIVDGTSFKTTRDDITRDYVGATELKALLDAWRSAGRPNIALDLYTAAPVRKLELLDFARRRFGLTIDWVDSVAEAPTGAKPRYVSTDHAAANLGYAPSRTALEVAADVLIHKWTARA